MFKRKPLRDDVRKEIQSRIVDGRLAAGQRINETKLAEILGLSRTPLREAMLTMVAAGTLDSYMGKGFIVPALEPDEFRGIQSLLSLLEPHALEQHPQLEPGNLMELSNILGRAKLHPNKPDLFCDLKFRWPAIVLERTINKILKDEIIRLETMSSRYWYAAVTNGFETTPYLESLTKLYELLREGKQQDGVVYWRQHIDRFTKLVAG